MRTRRPVRTYILLFIASLLPFYCVGAVLLVAAPQKRTPLPPAAFTATPQAVNPQPTITPAVVAASTITPSDLQPTPTVYMFPGPAPIVISPFQTGYTQCSDGPGGALNPAVRLSIPANTAPDASIYCRMLTASYQIADPAVVQRNALIAVDIFAFNRNGTPVTRFNSAIRVCLSGTGTFWFLDVNGQPRTGAQLPAVQENGFSCADIPNAGTVALTER